MKLKATTAAVGLISGPAADSDIPAFPSLRQSAALEFHASVQLLAERATFLTGATGVAIALLQGGEFVYSAATGILVPKIGTSADATGRTGQPLGECIEGALPVLSNLAVPVLRNEKVVGFFELAPATCAFRDSDLEAISRLSVMMSTVLDHLDAADRTENLTAEAKFIHPVSPIGPVLWHAPEPRPEEPLNAEGPTSPTLADVHSCTACGFPVSGVRVVCLDCEKLRDDPSHHSKSGENAPAAMFALENQESWLSAHGYAIASLLVTALAAAIILWLR